MSEYSDYLPELKSTTLFQNIEDDELLELLDVMKPEIVCRKAGSAGMPPIDIQNGVFCFVLKGKPLDQLESRPDVYNMPKITEPGMMMGEIPCLSEMHKSRAPRMKMKGPPHGGPAHDDFDLYMLRMSGDMVTKFYGERYSRAQGIMLRNFLGILAQKVTDVRKEKTAAAAQADKELAPYRLNVMCAGVSVKIVKAVAEKWNLLHPELPAVVMPGGSVNLIRDCIAGDPCDLLVSADDEIIRSMMMPEYAEGCRIWAGNRMVVTGDGINSDNWQQKLLDENAVFKHKNPYGDPGGYRAVMAILLANAVEPGLSQRLMDHSGHIGMEKNPGPFGNITPADYEFTYMSAAIASGRNFAVLPKEMDLSDASLEKEYSKVSFAVDEKNTVTATPIAHALTIPKNSLHKDAAKEFARMFLSVDKEAEGFIPKSGTAGKDPLE